MTGPRAGRPLPLLVALLTVSLVVMACAVPVVISTRADLVVIAGDEVIDINLLENDHPAAELELVGLAGPAPDGLVEGFDSAGTVTIAGVSLGHYELRYRVRRAADGIDGAETEGLLIVEVRPPDPPPPPGTFTASPPELDFGPVPVGEKADLPLVITNNGPGDLTLDAIETEPPFTIESGRDRCRSVAVDRSCNVTVSFTSGEAGPQRATARLRADGFEPVDVELQGEGLVGAFSILPEPAADFGTVERDRDARVERTFVNESSLDLRPVLVGLPREVRSTLDRCGEVPPGSSCRFTLTLLTGAVLDLGDVTAEVVADPAPPMPFSVRGRVVEQPRLLAFEITPDLLVLEGVRSGEVRVRNTGERVIDRFAFPPNTERLSFSATGCENLRPGAICVMVVSVTDRGLADIPFDDRFVVSADGVSVPTDVVVLEVTPPTRFEIVACHQRSEAVIIVNLDRTEGNLRGWTIHDSGPNYSKEILLDVIVGGGQTVRALSGLTPTAGPGEFILLERNIWNDEGGDIAHLLNPDGELVSRQPCIDE